MFVDELKEAFQRLLEQGNHNLLALTRKTGVNNSTLNRLNSQKADFENIPARTIQRLFPKMTVYFFPEDRPRGSVSVNGVNHGAIATGSRSIAVATGTAPVAKRTERHIDRDMLELQILESEYLTAEEQKKFLLFLKKEIK